MKNPKTNLIATHIGHDVVAYGAPATVDVVGYPRTPHFQIVSSDGCDDGAYFPAQSIQIHGLDAVTQLRDFCNELLHPGKQVAISITDPAKE